MQIFWAVVLVSTAVILFYSKRKIDNDTLGRAANVMGIVSAVAAIIVLAFYTQSLPPSEGQPTPAPENATVTISALKGWQDTGVSVRNGERVEVSVISGKWAYAQDQFLTSGEGDTQYVCSNLLPSPNCAEPLPTSPKGALIGQIGGMTFEVGSQTVVIAQENGYLKLRINDADDGLGDNKGSLQVDILK